MIKVVGWGQEEGQQYWIIENSWGTSWGENGFARVQMGIEGSFFDMYGVVIELEGKE